MIELGRTIDLAINARVLALDGAVAEAALPGVLELVPTYRSLLVHYDPLVVAFEELEAGLREVIERESRSASHAPRDGARVEESADGSGPVVEVPVAYGGAWGPDLADVARIAGLSDPAVVRRHADSVYRVAMLGFAPGFPYLMGMDPAIACPRLPTPRVSVPAGSIGIANTQTGIYPFAMPGGWRLIGRTDLSLFDSLRDPPATLRPGARVRFVPVQDSESRDRDGESHDGESHEARTGGRVDGPPGSRRAIRIVEPGPLATVQDGGRWGYQRYGVPPSGGADGVALAAGNVAVGNEPWAAAIEITAGPAEFEFMAAAKFTVTGATLELHLSGAPVSTAVSMSAVAGDRLRLGLPTAGLRAYLCVQGGIAVPEVLGSRSTCLAARFGGFHGRALRRDDVLPLGPPADATRGGHRAIGADLSDHPAVGPPGGRIELPFLPGGQWEDFPADARRAFLERPWRISHRSDRMGLRLEGEPLDSGGAGIGFVSDATVTGAIQVAGDGLPIVLGVDRQTTGGYPKLGAVASVGLHLLGQAQPGDELVFRPVSIEEAQRTLRAPGGRVTRRVRR